jgi:hypothetical protein
MASIRAANAQPQAPERQLVFVADDQDLGRLRTPVIYSIENCPAALIHERQRLEKYQVIVLPFGIRLEIPPSPRHESD